jgi:L-arabinonolactonase
VHATDETIATELVAIIPAQCVLGEGPVWDHRLGALWFTDIQSARLLRLAWPSRALERFALPERLGSLGLTNDPETLVCAFASGFALFAPSPGTIRWLHKTEPAWRGIRMNDGRVDRQGRFWAGSMIEDASIAPLDGGTLYRLDAVDQVPEALFSGIRISNSICFSPCGRRFYFADTPTQAIMTFDLDAASGALSDRSAFATLEGDAFPDGSDVDAAGRVWNAEWGSGRVTARTPDGPVVARIELPVSQVSCVTFGGADLDHLFVTTARDGLSGERLAREPHAGDVFVYKVGSRGLPANVFASIGSAP